MALGYPWYIVGVFAWALAVCFVWSLLYGYGQARNAYETTHNDA